MKENSEKKKILIIFTGPLDLGGIERSLISLLKAFDYDKYDVDFFLYGHHGELFEDIDKRVNLLPEDKELAYLRDSIKQKLRHGCYYSVFIRIRDEILSRLKKRKIDNDKSWAQVMRKTAPNLNEEYDLALGFFLPFDFLHEKVNAKIKVGWVHTDYYTETVKPKELLCKYRDLDYIACVSEHVRHTFCSVVPEYSDKTIVVGNCISDAGIRKSAELEMDPKEMQDDGSIKLLSIGRFCNAKNFDNVPDICSRVRAYGLNVKWYLIGFGPDEGLIVERIKQAGMEEYVIIIGKKANPYPYIKTCDLYVQPSRYEGRCVSVIEAQILNKPVVITDYPTAPSQLKDGYDGLVVPIDNDGCAAGIAALLNDPEKMKELSDNCKAGDYTNSSAVEVLYDLMGET